MQPLFNTPWINWLKDEIGFSPDFIDKIRAKIITLNEAIASEPSLGPQYRIGHSYLTPSVDAHITDPEQWFTQVAHTEIGPLISEYWFDDPKRANELLDSLLN